MFNWLRELLEIKYEFRERKTKVVIEEKVCMSCETLKSQLEIANYEKSEILKKLLKEPETKESVLNPKPQVIMPGRLAWNVRRQTIEAEDREKARLMRNAPKESTEDLEKELKVAEQTRESEAAKEA